MAPDDFSPFDSNAENPFQSPETPISRPPAPWSAGQPRTMCSEAIVAFVLSIVGIVGSLVCGLSPFVEIPALIIALIARNKIDANPNLDGRGLATAAMIISLVVLELLALGLIGFAIIHFKMIPSGNF